MRVLFLPDVRQYLQELQEVLLEKQYFGFEESAVQYVRDLIFDIEETLPIRPSKEVPVTFRMYVRGMRYAIFRKNRHTQWYVFFCKYHLHGEVVYLVRYISNNHMMSQHL